MSTDDVEDLEPDSLIELNAGFEKYVEIKNLRFKITINLLLLLFQQKDAFRD